MFSKSYIQWAVGFISDPKRKKIIFILMPSLPAKIFVIFPWITLVKGSVMFFVQMKTEALTPRIFSLTPAERMNKWPIMRDVFKPGNSKEVGASYVGLLIRKERGERKRPEDFPRQRSRAHTAVTASDTLEIVPSLSEGLSPPTYLRSQALSACLLAEGRGCSYDIP